MMIAATPCNGIKECYDDDGDEGILCKFFILTLLTWYSVTGLDSAQTNNLTLEFFLMLK